MPTFCQRLSRRCLALITGMAAWSAADLACSQGVENWPEFRGPTADGQAGNAELPLTWSETENVRWKKALPGRAWSSPVVWNQQVWLTTATEDGKELSAICLDRETGRELFSRKVFDVASPSEGHVFNSYASPTPAIEDGRVYLSWGSAGLACFDTATFELLWQRRDLECEHFRRAGSSPVIVGSTLVLNYDGFDYQYAIAFDKLTGDTVWKTHRPHDFGTDNGDIKKSFATCIVIETNGRRELISPASKGLFAFDPETGVELWRVRYEQFSCACRPLYDGELIYLNSGFSKGATLAIRPGGSGDMTDTAIVWSNERGMPNKPSPLLIDGRLINVSDTGIVSCLDAKTGRVQWQERVGGNFTSSPVAADGRIYLSDEDGRTVVIAAEGNYQLLAENTLKDGCLASPAVAGSSLFVRTRTHLYCFENPSTPAVASNQAVSDAVVLAPRDSAAATSPGESRIESIDNAMQPFIASHEAAGFVTLVARDGEVIHESAIGQANLERGTPMATDSMFWIASMTKPMSATALMILEQEGKLSIDDPVSKYIPEFEHLKQADGSPVRETLRIRHLLTHTSGLTGPDRFISGPGARSLAEQATLIAADPLAFEPGSKWQYGWSLQVVGRIVEIVSQKPFDEFLSERVFQPLKMQDATFVLNDDQAKRLATIYKHDDSGKELEPFANRYVSAEIGAKQPPMPSGGVFATAHDVHRFYQMLLNGGELDGVRILKPETVKKMTSCQTGDLVTGFTPGNCWGLGICIVRQPQGVSAALSPGSFGHGGAYGTQVWCDPKLKVVYVLMVQRSDLPNSDASDFRKVLQTVGREAIEKK
jgi:CubicO group peptidase (beta-lactamase class C family)